MLIFDLSPHHVLTMIEQIKHQIHNLREHFKDQGAIYRKANSLYIGGHCQVLTRSDHGFEVLINDTDEIDYEVRIGVENGEFSYSLDNKSKEWDSYGLASLMQLAEELQTPLPHNSIEGKAYTREGMIRRVLEERQVKAARAKYYIDWADNIYGEHTLTNDKGQKYKVTLRDFENETGYINNPDWRGNKLGTTKHIMFAFNRIKNDFALYNRLSKKYPFIEIYTDPLNEYRITWFYPHDMPLGVNELIQKYFGDNDHIPDEEVKDFRHFLRESVDYPQIVIRPEVEEKVGKTWENEVISIIREYEKVDYSMIKATLYPYQQEGVEFATFRKGAILADEMGLGKTLQAITTAINKKKLFGFSRTLIICPASLKAQWKKEIEKFSDESAIIVEGKPEDREKIYATSDAFFMVLNYETVLRDLQVINKMETDFIILDEAQRIKNFDTITANTIKRLHKKHALVITGTPIENRLTDLYSIMQFVDREFLEPLWEFSYQHCYFDLDKKDKITGYYNLQALNDRLKSILLRREKKDVIKELPEVTVHTIPVNLHPDQQSYHASYAKRLAQILSKKYISPYDLQEIMMLLTKMRMTCDSTFLVDRETYASPKLEELKDILIEKMDLKNSDGKIIIFSEWVTMLQLIGRMLHENGIGFAQLTGKVAVKNRDKLIKKFETNPQCKVFLASEAGGTGLNLQVADTVINFEIPWNPARRNQRIGRINRIGQQSKHLTVIDLIARNSIEMRIAAGLNLKQNLFDSVLNADNDRDIVDFSKAGQAQFLKQLEEAIGEFILEPEEEEILEEEGLDSEAVEVDSDQEMAENADHFTSEEVDDTVPGPGVSGTQKPVPEGHKPAPGNQSRKSAKPQEVQEMEQVMNQGLDFLSGLFKMATGKETGLEGKQMEYDEETGEVVMRFKMPKM